MKQSLLVLLLLLSVRCVAQSDEESVKQVIQSAYVDGIHNKGQMTDIRAGFHPSFIMFVKAENTLRQVPLEEWLSNIEKGWKETTSAPGPKATSKFVSVNVAGTSASVVLELYRGEKKIFTDNMLLYKFQEGWKIVTKSFFRYP